MADTPHAELEAEDEKIRIEAIEWSVYSIKRQIAQDVRIDNNHRILTALFSLKTKLQG